MRRYLLVVSISLLGFVPRSSAQPKNEDLIPIQIFQPPVNYFSASFNYTGRLSATFRNLGTIASANDIGDTKSEYSRVYNDGYVSKDSRTTDSYEDLPDDGRTNTWQFLYASQITADQRAIAFHNYSSVSDGASVEAGAVSGVGVDLEYSRRLQTFGKLKFGMEPPVAWGFLVGIVTSGANAKASADITATLHTVTDTYSLLGSTPPAPGYTAPSSTTETLTDSAGGTGTLTIDTTTLLANLPDSRTETDVVGAAHIKGFWQVRGAYYTFRTGPWIRWQLKNRFALRASLGPTVTWLGVHMRYNEQLQATESGIESSGLISASETTEDKDYAIPGAFGAVDAEFWVTRRTALFVSGTYETYSKEITITTGDRSADVRLSSGAGFRIGVTTRF